MRLSKRALLKAGVFATAAATESALAGRSSHAAEGAPPSPRNPYHARAEIFTVVTPDLDASIKFYGLLDYRVAEKGVLRAPLVNFAGIGGAGRGYVLLQQPDAGYGAVRLLQGSKNAEANRPIPGAHAWDIGFGAAEAATRDVEELYQAMIAAGVRTIAPPAFYYLHDIQRLNGDQMYPAAIDTLSYVALGPGGEPIYISVVLPNNFGMKFPHLHGALHNCFVVHSDRTKLWSFYEGLFGLKPNSLYELPLSSQQAVNRMLGETGGAMTGGGSGDGCNMEWMEWRAPPNVALQTWPQALDKLGHAMTTFVVDDLAQVRGRVKNVGLAATEGALPSIGNPHPNGFIVRGIAGELIEVVSR